MEIKEGEGGYAVPLRGKGVERGGKEGKARRNGEGGKGWGRTGKGSAIGIVEFNVSLNTL